MKAVAFAGVALMGVLPSLARAEPARVLSDLDDARACLPLPEGDIAVATGGGLVVVGHGGVRPLTALDGLPDTRVHALAADADQLWVGTEGGAAQLTLTPAPAVRRTWAGAAVHAVLATSTGVYLGTWGGGLLRWARGAVAPERVPTAGGGTRVSALAEDEGALVVAFADGPLVRVENGKSLVAFDGLVHGQALSTVASGEGRMELVLGDLEGLFRVSQGVTPIASVDARGLAQGPGGSLMVATYGSGLLAGPERGTLRREVGVPSFVSGVGARGETRCAATPEGMFVNARGRGYERVALGALPSNDVTAVVDDGGRRVVVGTFDHGAAIVEGDVVSPLRGLEPTETINAAAWQGSGSSATLWLATAHGLVGVAPPQGTPHRLRADDGLPSSFVRSLLVQPSGRLLVGTDEGAAWVDGNRVVRLAAAEKGGRPDLASPAHATWALAESADGTIWLGTNVGLYFGKEGSFRRAALATGDLRDDWVTALAIHDADVFVGTYAGGVTRLRAPREPGALLEHVHLGGGCINPGGLTLVGEELFAATMEGLLARPAGDDRAAWTARRGATPGRDVTAVRKVGETLWVGSRRGVGITRLGG